jgi:signal transduction histidine kinase
MLLRFYFIVWQIVVPFNSRPEEIDSLPEPTVEVTDSHVEQCQWIFDQAGARRVHLEKKGQSTFGLMVFLVPFLASLFVFIISRATISGTAIRTVTICLLIISAVLLLLGFISAMRAVGVKGFETLFLRSVIDEAGQFRNYSKAFHARGLLYCAAMNEAMNDHITQFVKGAHILTAAAVITLVVAVVPTSVVLLSLPSPPTQTKIVGPVEVSSPELIAVRDDVADLKKDIGKLLNSKATENELKRLGGKVAKIEAKLREIQKAMQFRSNKKGDVAPQAREGL